MEVYQSGSAFRRALEERLRAKSLNEGIPLIRLRKMVAFDRFLVRLTQVHPDRWLLKGGLSIQLRFESRARTTKDIDLLVMTEFSEVLNFLRDAGRFVMRDWFQFEVEQSEDRAPDGFGGSRFHIRSLLDGRTFEEFHLDVGIDDPVIDPIDLLQGPALLDFAGIQPTIVPCYPITQQIAEKVHAYTRPHASGERSRVKDFVDILLLAEFGEIDSQSLSRSIRATFEARKTHPLPMEIPEPPVKWSKSFHKMATEVALSYQSLSDANWAIKRFLNPVLSGEIIFIWNPVYWSWS